MLCAGVFVEGLLQLLAEAAENGQVSKFVLRMRTICAYVQGYWVTLQVLQFRDVVFCYFHEKIQ